MSKCVGKILLLAAMVSIACSTCRFAAAADWGSIKGRIIVENNPPKLPKINAVACNAMVPDESLILGKNNELANAVVYLRVAIGAPPVAVHPAFKAALNMPVKLDNKGCLFQPRIVVARQGQTLEVTNSDPLGHNTNISLLGFNQLIPPNGKIPATVNKTAATPMPIECNIHTWMKAYLLAFDHPYVTVTGNDGKFEIKDVPVGEHEFQFWHEKSGYLKNGRMKAGATDQRGRIKLKIQAGETLDLGDMKVRM